jgi:endonuclease I
MVIPKNEEETLRRWNDLDPVDQEEMDRNNTIEKFQRNRNPFIDFPSLANDISKF